MSSSVSSSKALLRRPLLTKPDSNQTAPKEGAKALDELVQDLNEIFDRNLSDIYDVANDNSSYAESNSDASSGYPKLATKGFTSPKTAYLKSMMRTKSHGREFSDHHYNSQPGLVQPYRPRGPQPLHISHPIKQPSLVSLSYLNAFEESQQPVLAQDVDARTKNEADFTLEDFLQPVVSCPPRRLVKSAIKKAVLSRHNYKKLTKLFADVAFKTDQQHLHQIYFSGEEVPAKLNRIPWRQLVLEMAAVLQEEASNMRDNVSTAQKAYNKFLKTAQGAAEIVGKVPDRFDDVLQSKNDVYQYTTAKFFENLQRSDSPVEKVEETALITADELAVLDTIVCGGIALSLKAHFIRKLPDISPLYTSLKYLNISFNEFRAIPPAIFNLTNLEILKMRSNPITLLPEEICNLSKLKCIVMAYCNIKSIPLKLFELSNLEVIDFRYNVLTFMPPEIRQLKNLKELNLDGNQLTYMPCGLLTLNKMKVLSVRNNFMHPLLWRNLTKDNSLQSLKDLCCVVINRNEIDVHSVSTTFKLTTNIQNVLQPDGVCDCCGHGLFGDGLRVVRPARKIYGQPNVPFLFVCCSPYCLTEFNSNSPNTLQYIYRNI